MSAPLFSIFQPPKKTTGTKNPLLIVLHGRGTDEHDLMGLVPILDERCSVVSIRAPYAFEYGGYTWFRLAESMEPDQATLVDSYRQLVATVESFIARKDVDPGKVFLLGFSMGTMMSFLLALTKPELFAGVAAQSGFAMELSYFPFQWNALEHCPFIITHGVHDPVIPIVLARRTKALFEQSNAEVVYREYPMEHQISDESLNDVSGWLTKQIDVRR
ncbi:MAG: alpha/beta fold hydrolase [Ignavibacteriales bacterium]|nr:alpha/beta fold hydrolase [Ignavibacteriales bacterium]